MTQPRIFLPTIGDFVENYEIQGKLGEGAFGNVYLVKDSAGKKKALKLLKLWSIPDERERDLILKRFRLEYETGLIQSNFLVHSEGYGFVNGNPFIVMEFCSKGDLRPFVDNSSSISFVKLKAIEILKGLKDLHSNGKIHRDLKPENVLIDANGTVKLTDFGISGHKNERLTIRDFFGNPLQVFGTYAYLPPEQLKRVKDTKLFTLDIYSFGVVFYELLTGRLPFGELRVKSDLADYNMNAARGNIRSMSSFRKDIPDELQRIVTKCLQPNPKDRYQNTDSVLRALGSSYREAVDRDSSEISPSLKVMYGSDNGAVFDLNRIAVNTKTNILNVGRDTESWSNHIYVRETDDQLLTKYISRKHATLEKHDQNWILRDGQWDSILGDWKHSLNGTYVNSNEVGTNGVKLTSGDIIILGDTTLKFN